MARPLKLGGRKFLLRPLNAVFGAPSHVALLRALAGAGRGLTGREVARAAGVAQRAALDALARLEEAGIVRRTPAGRANVYELKREHRLVRSALLPLFEQEGEIRAEIFRRLRETLEGYVVSGCVFGSVARGEETPESDLDVLAIVKESGDKKAIEDRVGALFAELRRDLGLRPSLLVMTRREFVEGYRGGRTLHQNMVKEGENFTGRPLKALIDD